MSYSQSREGGREERASRHPCGTLNPRHLWEGESHGEGKLGCVDGEKVDFYLKITGGRGARALFGERPGAIEVWRTGKYLNHSGHAKIYHREGP